MGNKGAEFEPTVASPSAQGCGWTTTQTVSTSPRDAGGHVLVIEGGELKGRELRKPEQEPLLNKTTAPFVSGAVVHSDKEPAAGQGPSLPWPVPTGHHRSSGQVQRRLRIKTLNTPRLGRTCLDTTKTTREEPTADGILNGETPSTLPLTSGRRRGRPVSPLSRTLVPGRGAGRSTGREGDVGGTCVSAPSQPNSGEGRQHRSLFFSLRTWSLGFCYAASLALRQTDRQAERQMGVGSIDRLPDTAAAVRCRTGQTQHRTPGHQLIPGTRSLQQAEVKTRV